MDIRKTIEELQIFNKQYPGLGPKFLEPMSLKMNIFRESIVRLEANTVKVLRLRDLNIVDEEPTIRRSFEAIGKIGLCSPCFWEQSNKSILGVRLEFDTGTFNFKHNESQDVVRNASDIVMSKLIKSAFVPIFAIQDIEQLQRASEA